MTTLRNESLCRACVLQFGRAAHAGHKEQLERVTERRRVERGSFGRKRTAYSFRHTYASNQIRKGTDIYTLAINMRTSVRMIEMYYSDVVPDEMARQLEGGYD